MSPPERLWVVRIESETFERTLERRADGGYLNDGFTRDTSGVSHVGTGDLEVRVASAEDYEWALPLFRDSYDAS